MAFDQEDMARRCQESEERIKDLESRVGYLETNDAASDEKIKTIFAMLTRIETLLEKYTEEMKSSMKELATDIEKLKGRSGAMWDNAILSLIAAVVGAIVMYLFKGA